MKRKFTLLSISLLLVGLTAFFLSGQTGLVLNPSEGTESEPLPSTIRLASFNVLHLGWNNDKNLDDLAQILACFDIIALQEVMKKSGGAPDPLIDLKVVRNKVQELTASQGSPEWESQVTPHPIGRSTYKEYYAFLYRTDRVHYIGNSEIFPDPKDLFIREPFYATFRSGKFDFILINVHAVFEGDLRDDEIAGLKDVFATVQSESTCENDVILVGDFNTPADDEDWSLFKTIPTVKNLISHTVETSISDRGMSKPYDNIWIQTEYTDYEFADQTGVYLFFEDLYSRDTDNMYATARDILSDHVPVWAEFHVDLPDDDGPCP